MLGREADLRVAKQRLLEPQTQPILVAAGDQRETRGGADGGIGIALKEAHPSRDIGRGKVAASVTGDVGIAEVVGENKDDVRWSGGRLGICTDATRRERSRPEGGIAQQLTTRHSRLPSHRRVLRSAEVPTLSAKPILASSSAAVFPLLVPCAMCRFRDDPIGATAATTVIRYTSHHPHWATFVRSANGGFGA